MSNKKIYNYLQDINFLRQLEEYKIRTTYIKVLVLTFEDKPLAEISGKAIGGTINVSGDSCLRRTLNNLTMIADEQINKINNLNNIISLNKKIKIEIGLENPIKDKYDKILWFPQGTFLITSGSVTEDSSGIRISISGKDKMVQLDGTIGGTFPDTVIFHEKYEYKDKNKEEIKITNPTIFQIIQEAVSHFGNENVDNIIISDLPNTAKKLVKYMGELPIRFSQDYSQMIVSKDKIEGYNNKYIYGEDIGYMETPLTYPGELIFQAGQTVVDLLNKLCELLGNYEFFYDIQGNFIFQEKKNYLNHQFQSLIDLKFKDYIYTTFNTKYAYSFINEKDIISCSNTPNFNNIKNNFLVIGQRTNALDETYNIKYHLAIDKKPFLNKSIKYMWTIRSKETDDIVRYEYTDANSSSTIHVNFDEIIEQNPLKPGKDWREELYRQALENSLYNNEESIYDQELLTEWRKIFNPNNMDWKTLWIDKQYSDDWIGWNPKVIENPSDLVYWLDFIDSSNYLTNFSIKNIGCRTKVINNTDINTIYNNKVEDIIFLDINDENLENKINNYTSQGQPFHQLQEEYLNYFFISGTKASAFDVLRESIYQNLTYQDQISITCQPKYYLEPNSLIYIREKKANIEGEYFINSFNIPLNFNGTMTINATKNLTRDILT